MAKDNSKQYGQYSENQIIGIVSQLMSTAQGTAEDEISNDRAQALDFYQGDMDKVMPVEVDRSDVVSRDVLDAVESILPGLVELFEDEENGFEFKPIGSEDEEAADQETQVVRQIVFGDDNAYLNLYTFLKDALLSKTGILKVSWEDAKWMREEYENLTEDELNYLLNEAGIDIEVLDSKLNDDGTFNLTLKTKRKNGKVVIYPVPPEEFGVDQHTVSPNVKESHFVYHRVKKTASDLIAEGYDRDLVMTLPFDDTITSSEQLARYRYEDEQVYGAENENPSTRTTWITEAYLYLDIDDDGIGELQKVTIAGNSGDSSDGGGTMMFMDMEPVDRIPFVTATPFIRTHTFFGNSVADFVMEIQVIRTLMLRSVVDNTMQANNLRTAVNEAVNLDDLMQNRPGGVVRTEGTAPPSSHIFPMPANQVPDAAYTLLEYMDDRTKQRVGAGDDVVGLDSEGLANVNTGVAMAALEQARMKLKLIARNIAECGLKPLFMDVHELLQKNADKEMAIKLRGEWTAVSPSEWRERTDMTVNVGVGKSSKDVRLAKIDDTINQQTAMLQTGLPLVNPQNIYELLAKKTRLLGLDPSETWTDPSTLPPPQPPQPDPLMVEQLNIQKQYNQDKFKQEADELEFKRMQFVADTVSGKEAAALKEKQAFLEAKMAEDKQEHTQHLDMVNTLLKKQQVELDAYRANLTAATTLAVAGVNSQLTEELTDEVTNELIEENIEQAVSKATDATIVDAEIKKL